jgi:hypothetical protein
MTTRSAIVERINALIKEGEAIEDLMVVDDVKMLRHQATCLGFISQMVNVVELACPQFSAYRHDASAIRLRSQPVFSGDAAEQGVLQGTELLRRVSADLNAGLLAPPELRGTIKAFDDFLDHAEDYLKHGRVEPAGVIAGVSFEDAVRQLGRIRGYDHPKLDEVIAELGRREIFNTADAHLMRSGAAVRTAATHGRWGEFDKDNVRDTITIARRIISEHLQGTASPLR